MKIIAQFEHRGTRFAVIEMNGQPVTMRDNSYTAQSSAYPAWRGADADSLALTNAHELTSPGLSYRETPIAQQSVESNVKVPFLTALISGAFTGALTLCGWQFIHWPQPVTATIASTLLATWWSWRGSLEFARGLLTHVEEFVNVDIDRDGQIGNRPAREVLSPFPIRTSADDKATPAASTAVEAKPVERREQSILIRPREQNRDALIVTLGEVWDFLLTSFSENGDNEWSRAAWQRRGMSRDTWEAYQNFLTGLNPEWWKFTDRPTLDRVLRRFGWTNTRPPIVPPARPNEGV